MSETDFKSEYQCEVPKVSGDVKIYDEYSALVEEFDRRVCTGRVIDGGRMPANRDESYLVNQNALSIRKHVMLKYGISSERFQEIIKEFNNRGSDD